MKSLEFKQWMDEFQPQTSKTRPVKNGASGQRERATALFFSENQASAR